MTDMKYDTSTLRDGSRQNRQASDAADQAAAAVRKSPVAAGPFGNVTPAGSLAGVLSQAQSDHAKGAEDAATNRDTKALRVDKTADAGDELVVVTTAAAQSGTARDVANGMG